MAQKEIDVNRMMELVDTGLNQSEVARKMGVTRAAVSKKLMQVRSNRLTPEIVTNRVSRSVGNSINAIEQLQRINDKANELLDEVKKDPLTSIKIIAEIRAQLRLQLEIFSLLYDLQAADDFMQSVLETLGEVDKDVRDKVVQRLNERSAVRSAINYR